MVVQDVTDAHEQAFLRGHDAHVCVVTTSHTGRAAASGQVASAAHTVSAPGRSGCGALAHAGWLAQGDDAPVIVWDLESRAHVYVLEGLRGRVNQLCFSGDDAFLAATDTTGQLVVWDMKVGG